MERLFEDRAFIGRLKTRWQALYARRGEVDRWITDYTRSLEHWQRLTHPMWLPYAPLPLLRMDGFGETDLSQPRVRILSDLWTDAAYDNEVTELRTWLNSRWAWLHTGIMDLQDLRGGGPPAHCSGGGTTDSEKGSVAMATLPFSIPLPAVRLTRAPAAAPSSRDPPGPALHRGRARSS